MQRGALIGPNGVVADHVTWCLTLRERLQGVLGRPPLEPDEAYVITDSKRVHTRGVPYPLDCVFCDRDWRVLHVETLQPMSRSAHVAGSLNVIELLGGRAAENAIAPGTRLSFGKTR